MNSYINFLKYTCFAFIGLLMSNNAVKAQLYFPPADYEQYMSWIDYNKTYYRIIVEEDGIYRLSYDDLINAGVPATLDPRRLQMYYHGSEIPIRVSGESDGVLDSLDYVEFYGKQRDSEHERLLYPNFDNDKPTPELALYGNKSVYFLTYTTSTNDRGLRMQTFFEQNTQGLEKESFHIEYATTNFSTQFPRAPLFPTSIVDAGGKGGMLTDFMEGRGHTGATLRVNKGVRQDVARIKIVNYVGDSLVNTEFSFRMMGMINIAHGVKFYYRIGSKSEFVEEKFFTNYEVVRTVKSIPDSLGIIQNGDFFFNFENTVPAANFDFLSYSGGYVKYPQATRMEGEELKKFYLRTNSVGKSYLEIENPTAQVRFFDVTDPKNVLEIESETSSNLETLIVPNTAFTQRTIVATNVIKSVLRMEKIAIKPITNPSQYDYLILTAEKLKQSVGDVSDPVQAYATYRSSESGGSYSPLIVTVEQLYTMFSYGETTPLAIRRFANYMLSNGNPDFLFIVGKSVGILPSNPDDGNIPPYGTPASDHMLTAGLRVSTLTPAIATGRLPAKNPQEVLNYLNKVKEHENTEGDQSWRKNILHLSGGYLPAEHAAFKRYVEGFEYIAEGKYLGAKVSTLSKKTSDFVEFIDISEKLNSGISVATFFGHSSPDFTDIEIGYVSRMDSYNNKGRYPMFIVNGCETARAFTSTVSISEDWVITPDKGAILFLAHSDLGFSGQLRLYTQTFYEEAFSKAENISEPIGFVMQDLIDTYMARNGFQNEIARAAAQQILLLGDPAVRLIPLDKPDYMIDNTRVSIVPAEGEQVVTANSDQFRVKVVVDNLSIMDKENRQLTIRVKRTYADGSEDFMRVTEYPAVAYRDTLYYDVFVGEQSKAKSIGLNKFEVFIDFFNEVPERNEENNYGVIEYFIQRGAMLTLAPKEYSIVNQTSVNLIAQNSNPFTNVRTYEYEIDTTHLFNSSVKRSTIVEDYITTEWQVNLPVTTDSTVYYWRVRYAEPQGDDNTEWATSSFIYINNSPAGWSQSHVAQFDKATLSGLTYPKETGQWQFKDYTLNFEVQAAGGTSSQRGNYFVKMNGETIVSGDCYDNRMLVLAIDSRTGTLYNPLPITGCGSSLAAAGVPFYLNINTIVANSTITEYMKGIRDGDYLIMMNTRGSFKNTRQPAAVAQLGLTQTQVNEFTARANDAAFVIVGRKGAPAGSAILFNLKTRADVINETFTLTGLTDKGIVKSSLIGPATQWGNMFREFHTNGADDWQLDVLGVNFAGSETILQQDVTQDNYSLSDINASQYPYLRLRATLSDSVARTSPQLDRWQVIYREVPEGILLYDTLSYRQNTNLQVSAGDSASIRFRFRNISGSDFQNPLVVRYTVRNIETGIATERFDTLTRVLRNEELSFDAKFYSLDYLGDNELTVFANPRSEAEQIYENNILQAKFTVIPDNINPVLDVAFDGIHIMDGDIISPSPLISIQLRDENRFLIRQDTVGINMYLTTCDSCEQIRLNYNDQNLQWFASPDNNFRLEYKADRLADGKYTLVVEAADLSGNRAGAEPYKVNFEVINKSTITHFYPYPNPFSTKMHFVFTLTGAEMPDDIRIQIMTITGKVVRTINKDELGAIRIGNNISEFTWDGTDEFGDKLANGVYLYKVDLRDNSQQFEHRETAKDDLFKKNIGKIYLMR